MQLRTQPFAIAASVSAGVGFTICSLMMAQWPRHSLQMVAELMHLKTLKFIAPIFKVTPTNYTSGLVQVMIYTYLFALLTALFYNLMVGNKK